MAEARDRRGILADDRQICPPETDKKSFRSPKPREVKDNPQRGTKPCSRGSAWWACQDSNLKPSGYEPLALTIELQALSEQRQPTRACGRSRSRSAVKRNIFFTGQGNLQFAQMKAAPPGGYTLAPDSVKASIRGIEDWQVMGTFLHDIQPPRTFWNNSHVA